MNIIDGGTITFKQTEEKCWLCRKNVNNQPNVLFTIEFDSYIHESCLKDELEKDSPNPELTFIAREFSDRDDYYKQFLPHKPFAPSDENQMSFSLWS